MRREGTPDPQPWEAATCSRAAWWRWGRGTERGGLLGEDTCWAGGDGVGDILQLSSSELSPQSLS